MNKKILLATVLLLFFQPIFGGVNLKNGNFYISYTDIQFGDQYIFDSITRTYNSKSTFSSILGYGWGTDIATFLKVYPDGNIVIKEHGGGASTLYTTSFFDESMIDLMIEEILVVAIDEGDINNTPAAISNFQDRLRNDSELRYSNWDKYLKKGLVENLDSYPNGTVWESFERGNQKITKTEEGFVRSNTDETYQEVFNDHGQLIRKRDNSGKIVELIYGDEGNLDKMINHDGTEVNFTFNDTGKIISIEFNGQVTTFDYDGEDLVKGTDTAGNIYLYSYDKIHNMTSIEYDDGSKQTIEYHDKTYYVKKITDRNGVETSYEYIKYFKKDGTEDDDHYATEVTKENYYGELTTNFYEYWIGTDSQGNRYTQRIKTRVNGIETITTYDELCNKPLEIERGRHATVFAYNNRCLMTEKKSTNGESVEIKYHDTLEKIVWVKNEDGVTTFDYDEKGNLTHAAKEGDGSVTLVYNEAGKIVIMESDDSKLTFSYNESGKPVEIVMEDIGALQVEYDGYGEIVRVHSEEGSDIALKLTQAFQELLSLVKPAGVDLGM